VDTAVEAIPDELYPFFELPAELLRGGDCRGFVAALAGHMAAAKVRTGGVTTDAFPAPQDVATFLVACQGAGVPFKATAGLHHPIRCFRPLTYSENSPQGAMHGFLNVLLMTGFARESFRVGVLEEIMEEEFEEVFTFNDKGVFWRGEHFLPTTHLDRVRRKGMVAFGSCSFDEPVEDLRSLGLL